MNFFSLFKRKILYQLKKKINIDLDDINKTNLDELFHYYGSDKANIFIKTQKKGHGFSEFYTKHLKYLRKEKINILEIGSFAGASAAAFSKYFPNSTIHCLDINISNFIYSSKKINIYGLDIRNNKELINAIKEINLKYNCVYFDVIIDDGSHYLSDILFTFKNLFKFVKNEGIYIIEDFKHPNYYSRNKDVEDILISSMLDHLKVNKLFKSNIINEADQIYFHKSINKIDIYKGNLKDSDICFIEKN